MNWAIHRFLQVTYGTSKLDMQNRLTQYLASLSGDYSVRWRTLLANAYQYRR